MHFATLAHTDITTLTNTFNEAFAGYELSLQMTPKALQHKIMVEDIDLSFSVGAFDGDQLAGFIFWGIGHVNDRLCAWDGGTGVIPQYRGRQLTQKMFAHALPLLKNVGVTRLLLEVLENNKTAYDIYSGLGFKETRILHAYEGNVERIPKSKFTVETIRHEDAAMLAAMADWTPAWQQMNKRIQNRGADITTIGIKEGAQCVAYAQYHYDTRRNSTRVCQFAVAKTHRRQGLGTALFQYIQEKHVLPITVINVDGTSVATNSFVKAIGLPHLISQYEMDMLI